uniref:Mitochondrial FtsZ2 n=1 Tax=Malawimonas californiana TaxID=221722 RepID=A0A0E3ST15_MALCL|nr:mitochondrial FtsZ2 [Malawimonas californiana]
MLRLARIIQVRAFALEWCALRPGLVRFVADAAPKVATPVSIARSQATTQSTAAPVPPSPTPRRDAPIANPVPPRFRPPVAPIGAPQIVKSRSMPKPAPTLPVFSSVTMQPTISVIGVGGAGCNAVNNMISSQLTGVEFVAANTDVQSLHASLCVKKVQLGTALTQGLGAGARPDIGRAACEETFAEIDAHIKDSQMVFITAGMGGGTGTGAAPVIAEAAKRRGILTVGVVSTPFHFEGPHRMRLALNGISALEQSVDTLIVVPNQNLLSVSQKGTTFKDAFKMADNVLYAGVRGVTELILLPGLINLDFADVCTVMRDRGRAVMGTGEATGADRAKQAAFAALSNPLLTHTSIRGARGVLINITGGKDLALFDVDQIANAVREQVDAEANIIFGTVFDAKMNDRIRVSIIAAGLEGQSASESIQATLQKQTGARPQPARVRADSPSAASTAANVSASANSTSTQGSPGGLLGWMRDRVRVNW